MLVQVQVNRLVELKRESRNGTKDLWRPDIWHCRAMGKEYSFQPIVEKWKMESGKM